jgi:hypothetical protein
MNQRACTLTVTVWEPVNEIQAALQNAGFQVSVTEKETKLKVVIPLKKGEDIFSAFDKYKTVLLGVLRAQNEKNWKEKQTK